MLTSRNLAVAVLVGALGVWAPAGLAQIGTDTPAASSGGDAARGAAAEDDGQAEETAAAEPGEDEEVQFTEAFLNDPEHIAVGKTLWEDTCRHCHGRSAYPGKAPKLKPRKYTPDFVYDRVTYGFRKMPAWEDVFTQEERMSITAYILSKKFAP